MVVLVVAMIGYFRGDGYLLVPTPLCFRLKGQKCLLLLALEATGVRN